ASMKHERYLSFSLMTDSTPISNSVTLTFTSALSDQIETSSNNFNTAQQMLYSFLKREA
ncbi:MAG: hypothetical protein DID90_2727552969, partial [Candidatus Nitrotoga sp. LAW]